MEADSINSSSVVDKSAPEAISIELAYEPTPLNRPLRTPHSGYHFDRTDRKFFEGWYFKVSIPERGQSFCFMYSVENPAFAKKLSTLEEVQYGPRFTGAGAQILGADDKYICQYTDESTNFWASRDDLMLGNTFVAQKNMKPPSKEIPPQVGSSGMIKDTSSKMLLHTVRKIGVVPSPESGSGCNVMTLKEQMKKFV